MSLFWGVERRTFALPVWHEAAEALLRFVPVESCFEGDDEVADEEDEGLALDVSDGISGCSGSIGDTISPELSILRALCGI